MSTTTTPTTPNMQAMVSLPRNSSPPPEEVPIDPRSHPSGPHRILSDGTFEIFDSVFSNHKGVFSWKASYKSYEADHCPHCPAPRPFQDFLLLSMPSSNDPLAMKQYQELLREERLQLLPSIF